MALNECCREWLIHSTLTQVGVRIHTVHISMGECSWDSRGPYSHFFLKLLIDIIINLFRRLHGTLDCRVNIRGIITERLIAKYTNRRGHGNSTKFVQLII